MYLVSGGMAFLPIGVYHRPDDPAGAVDVNQVVAHRAKILHPIVSIPEEQVVCPLRYLREPSDLAPIVDGARQREIPTQRRQNRHLEERIIVLKAKLIQLRDNAAVLSEAQEVIDAN